MKKILRYSFTLLLVLSCLIVVPVTLVRDRLATAEEETAATTLPFTPSTRPRPTTVTDETTGTATTTAVSGSNNASTDASAATTTTAPTTTLSQTPEETFADTLFIGDSRTYGFVSYNIRVPGATFFSEEGMNSFNTLKRSLSVADVGTVTLEQLLRQKRFKQVYIMFGLNEIQNKKDPETTAAKHQEIIGQIAAIQPDAKIIVQSVLHVTKAKSDRNTAQKQPITNARIDEFNQWLSQLADEPYVYYLDVNDAFDDADGALNTDYAAGDGMHIKVRGYTAWRDFLFDNRIV